MSTLSGIVSKGEKGKTKYQSLDINSLYRTSRGESLEQQQQKSTVPRKHGMQSLGKVPSARRPPANLPSLRSETSSGDPAVSLVPSGGSGWATTKESAPTTNTTTTSSSTPSDNTANNTSAQCTTGSTSAISQQHPPLPGQQSNLQTPHPSEVGNKSSWSAIMSRSGDAGGGQTGQQQAQQSRENAQYGPGPSLRPQTEGSWIQGGSRPTGGQGAGGAAGVAGSGNIQVGQGPPIGFGGPPGQGESQPGGRPNLAQSPGMGMAQAGQQNQGQIPPGPNMNHYRGIIPQFMYRGNFPGGNFPGQFPPGGTRTRINYPPDQAPPQRGDRDRGPSFDKETIQTRPIIKEEDLSRMDDISRDAGWTASDDIDYNQKLAFSDDELDDQPSGTKKEENRKELEKQEEKHVQEEKEMHRDKEQKESGRIEPRNDMQSLHSWNNKGQTPRDYRGPPGQVPPNYPPQQPSMRPAHPLRGDEEEVWNQRRREQSEKVISTIERARQRKEEEEKRFQESQKQAAAKKLQDLENKLKEKHKHNEEQDSSQSGDTVNKSGSASSTSTSSIIPVPEWERDRESRERSRTSSSEGAAMKEADVIVKGGRDQPPSGHQSTSNKSAPPLRRTRADSDVSGSLDDDRSGGPRAPPPLRSDDRHRHSGGHRSGSGYESARKSDGGYYDDYSRRGGERYKEYDFEDRHPRDVGKWADDVERRYDEKDSRDARDGRDMRDRDLRDKKDYDNYSKGPSSHDTYDEPHRDSNRSEQVSGSEWRERDDRRDARSHDDRLVSGNESNRRSGEMSRPIDEQQRNERPQRPDSRDSRASRESRGSLRNAADDESGNFHKPGSWANDFSDYEDNKKQRDIFREDNRERDRERDRDREGGGSQPRDRRHPPGPISKEKLDQEEIKRGMTQLKRLGVDDKKDSQKMIEHDSKKDSEAWGRNKSDRTNENVKRGLDNVPKSTAWAEAVSPTFEKEEEEKRAMEHDDDKKMNDLKMSIEKLGIDKRANSDLDSGHLSNEADKDDRKDEKRDKNARNRASSSGSRGPRSNEPRGTRQWGSGGQGGGSGGTSAVTAPGGAFNVYGQRWRGSEVPARGRRSGASRLGGRKGPNYERTDSELSGDEAISGSTESSKDDRRPVSARSPKPSAPKSEKDERNRSTNISRKDDQQQSRSEYSQSSRGEKRGDRGADKAADRDYDVRGGTGRPGREGFAPSGEPSRRGRGGFRNNRGSAPASATGGAAGARMEGYGPPPSKSPFSSERADEKHSSGQQHSSTPTPSDDGSAGGSSHNQTESADDKIIAKQQALTAGITGGRHAKSPNQLSANHVGANVKTLKKEESKSKRTRSGSRRGRGGGSRGTNAHGMPNNKHGDPNNEEWETTSENSEEDRKDAHGGRSSKPFEGRGERQSSNPAGSIAPHPREPRGHRDREPRGDKGPKSSNSQSNRAPGAEKSRNAQNVSERSGNKDGPQRNHHPGSMPPPLMQNSQAQNGRPRSQGSANSGPIKPISNKDVTVNRIDDIKLNDSNLVNQVLSDIHSKSKDKRGSVVSEIESDSNCIDANLGDDNKIDADGFQEVRSKKNVKDSTRQQQQQKEEQQQKSGRREKDKDRVRDRSKSKANGPPAQPQQQQQQQPTQNIPPLLGPPIGQVGAGMTKNYERGSATRQKLAPRFQKQRLAKQQQQSGNESDSANGKPVVKDALGGVAPPPTVNAWDKPFTGSSRSPPSPAIGAVPADVQLMSGLTPGGVQSTGTEHEIPAPDSQISDAAQRNSPNIDKVSGKLAQIKEASVGQEKGGADTSSPPVQTLIFENTNYSKNTKNIVVAPNEMVMKSKYSNHIKGQGRDKRSTDIDDDAVQLQQHQQQQALAAAFSTKPSELIKDKLSQQDPIQMPLSFNNKEDNVDMKLDFTFDSDLSQLTEDKSKSLSMSRSMHMSGGQSTISPSTAELNLKIASVKKVWENAPPMPTVVEHEVDGNVSAANSFPQAFESNDVDDGYSHQQYSQSNLKNDMSASTNVCKLVPPQVKPQQQSSAGGTGQPGSTVPGPSPIGPGQSPIGHPPASLQGPLSPPPFNSTGQPSHINYQYPSSQAAAAQYGSMSAIPSPPAVLFNTGSAQLPAQAAGGLYGAFQLDQSRSSFTQYPPYAASLQSSLNQQNLYLQQPPPPHAPNAPAPDMYQSNFSQYRLAATGGPPFGQNQQLSNNPNTVLISSSSNSLMSASVKSSTQPIGAIGTKAPHFQAPSAPPQPNQLAYIQFDPNVLGVSGSYMGNSQLVQRPGPNVQPSANNYYNATSADVFSGSQTGFYQPGGAAQQTGTHYSLQGFGQHNQSLATGNAAPVGLQNFGSQFLSGSGLQIAAAAAAQQYRNPTSGLPGPANAAATFLSKHQQQEQPRQLKSPSGNQQDVLSVFSSSTFSNASPKSRKQQSSSQQPQPNQTQHHKFQQYSASQSGLVNSYNNYQQNPRGMGMQRGNIQPSQQRYPPPIQRPVNPFPPGPNNSQQGQGQQNCMPNQQQQSQMNRHRTNIHQQQQQQRNMKMQQQYYSGPTNVKMDSHDKVDTHNDKISDNNSGNQSGGNKSSANPPEVDNKEEVTQQTE